MSSGDPFTYSSRSAYRINHLRLIKDRLEISQFVYIYSGVYKYKWYHYRKLCIYLSSTSTKNFQDLVGNCSQNKKMASTANAHQLLPREGAAGGRERSLEIEYGIIAATNTR